jgi:hypothetical protein
LARRVDYEDASSDLILGRSLSSIDNSLHGTFTYQSSSSIEMAADPVTKITIDELLSYDFDDDDPLADNTFRAKRDDKSTLSPRGTKRAHDVDKENFGDLGLDQEVKIKKRKIPIPKLDDQRYV